MGQQITNMPFMDYFLLLRYKTSRYPGLSFYFFQVSLYHAGIVQRHYIEIWIVLSEGYNSWNSFSFPVFWRLQKVKNL